MVADKKHLRNGILTVIGAALIQFSFGHFYTLANMTPYILSYIKARVDPNANEGLVVWLSGLGYGAQGLSMPVGGYLAKKIDYRIVVAIASVVESGSILLTYFTVTHSFATVILTYAVLNGLGLGFAYSAVMEVASAYFPSKRGMIMGIVVGGYGLSALVFTPIQKGFINPNDVAVNGDTSLFDDPSVLDRVPNAFLLIGGILLAVQLIGCLLLRERPKSKSQYNDSDEDLVENDSADDITESEWGEKTEEPEDCTPLQVLRRLDFYLLWMVLATAIIPISVFISNYKKFGLNCNLEDKYVTIVVTLSAIFNSGGRVVWGIVADKISFKFPLCTILVWFAALLFSFPHFCSLDQTALKALYIIWVAQMFFCLSATFTLLPAAMSTTFGPKYMAVNYGILFNACFVGSMIIGGVLSAVKIEKDLVPLFSGVGGVCLIAFCVAIWVNDRKIPRKLNICRWCATRCGREDN